MRVLVAHPGTQHAPRLARELGNLGLLGEFWTGFGLAEGARLPGWLPERLCGKLRARTLAGVPGEKLRCVAWAELAALAAVRCGAEEERVLFWRNGVFQRAIPDQSLRGADAVIGFDTSSWILADRCQRRGIPLLLEQTTPHSMASRGVYAELTRRIPDWPPEFAGKGDRLIAIEAREHAAASLISVASTFSRGTLIEHGVEPAKVRVNPYGVDLDRFQPSTRGPRDGHLRFLFLGAVTARKGLPVLLDAWRTLPNDSAELIIAGPVLETRRHLIEGVPGITLRGSVRRDLLPALFSEADVFVFPTMFDGFGLALLEAMAAGLPVIATDACAGPDLITEGNEGFLVPAGDAEALAERIRFFVTHPDAAAEMGRRARVAAERFTWAAYGERAAGLLREIQAGARR